MIQSRIEIPTDSGADWLDLPKLFGRRAPLHVDLGCGDGLFLFEMAQIHPDKNFLGIERLAKRVDRTARKAARLENMRVIRGDTLFAIEILLPAQSVQAFYLLFPDPWPKRRHHRRRILTVHFLQSIHRALEPGGTLQIATDHPDYFDHIHRVVSDCAVTCNRAPELDGLKPSSLQRFEIIKEGQAEELPQTKFEQKFRAAGVSIYRLALRKVSPVT